ncbi:hypothetical protein CYMTET_18110 [Cymbomonas tetramitiformis]|uniref:Apple domain-containing protein n=1 Tax=Cymbomonas tetramitiformis TaxID=36881 RepID=A0AAE0L690_9CHLO|nr:hypothetical protein CYMTET_18110 [Cymbomonas tetramitiformis]
MKHVRVATTENILAPEFDLSQRFKIVPFRPASYITESDDDGDSTAYPSTKHRRPDDPAINLRGLGKDVEANSIYLKSLDGAASSGDDPASPEYSASVPESNQTLRLNFFENTAFQKFEWTSSVNTKRHLTSHMTLGKHRTACPSYKGNSILNCYDFYAGICSPECPCCKTFTCYCGGPIQHPTTSLKGAYRYSSNSNLRCHEAYLVSKQAYDVTFSECENSCSFDDKCRHFLYAAGTCYKHSSCTSHYASDGFTTYTKMEGNGDPDIDDGKTEIEGGSLGDEVQEIHEVPQVVYAATTYGTVRGPLLLNGALATQ